MPLAKEGVLQNKEVLFSLQAMVLIKGIALYVISSQHLTTEKLRLGYQQAFTAAHLLSFGSLFSKFAVFRYSYSKVLGHHNSWGQLKRED